MTTIQLTIDEVPVKVTSQGLELTTKDDHLACGLATFGVDVYIYDDGDWNITEVFPMVNSIAGERGEKVARPYSITAARHLEDFAYFQISDKVKETIMQSDRKEFPKVARI